MKNFLLILSSFFLATQALGEGGVIGGGDLTFRKLMVCDAEGATGQPTTTRSIWVVKETDFEGRLIEGATLRVVTVDSNASPTRFYVTHTTELSVLNSKISLDLWRYDELAPSNHRIGSFVWDGRARHGSMSASGVSSDVEELLLANCNEI